MGDLMTRAYACRIWRLDIADVDSLKPVVPDLEDRLLLGVKKTVRSPPSPSTPRLYPHPAAAASCRLPRGLASLHPRGVLCPGAGASAHQHCDHRNTCAGWPLR